MAIEKYFQSKTCTHENPVTDANTGEVFCGPCGQVLQERTIDVKGERRFYNLDRYLNRSRSGEGITLRQYDKGLSTFIGTKNVDFVGRQLNTKNVKEFSRLRIWDIRSKSQSYKKSIAKALRMLDAATKKLGLSDPIAEDTAYIFRKASEAQLIQGRKIRDMVAASIYAACRESNTPRTMKDVGDAVDVSTKRVFQTYKLIKNLLNLKIEPPQPSDYLPKLISKLELNEKTSRLAFNILKKAEMKEILMGSKPTVVCAGAIYLSCMINNQPRTQHQVADASQISSVAVRSVVPSLKKII